MKENTINDMRELEGYIAVKSDEISSHGFFFAGIFVHSLVDFHSSVSEYVCQDL